MLKTGIIIDINKSSLFIMTSNSELYEIKNRATPMPHIGEIYTGEPVRKNYKLSKSYQFILPIIAVIISFALVYSLINEYTTSYSVVLELSSSFQINLNRSSKILKVNPLNNNAADLIKDIDLKHKPIDEALLELLKKAETMNYLKNYYSNKEKPIYIYITTHNNIDVDLSSFQAYADSIKVNVIINDDGQQKKKH